MTTVVLNVDLVVDIRNSKASAVLKKVSDSTGTDRTKDFENFCTTQNFPLSTQAEIEEATVEFVKANPNSLP